MAPADPHADRLLGFTLPASDARGRVVRLDSTLAEILAAHAYPEPLARLLAEALVLAALLGALFRPDEGQLTLQARGEGGPCTLLVADYRDGALRGYAALDLDRRFPPASDGSLAALLGDGRLVITLDQTAAAERYQGIVPLGAESLEAAAQEYFNRSEQVPTVVRIAAGPGADGIWRAGGLLVQQTARAEAGGSRLHVDSAGVDPASAWDHVRALASTLSDAELRDPQLPLEDLLWRLFHDEPEVRVTAEQPLSRGCRCSVEHIRDVLGQFPEAERQEMRNADGVIAVDCEFCARQFQIAI